MSWTNQKQCERRAKSEQWLSGCDRGEIGLSRAGLYRSGSARLAARGKFCRLLLPAINHTSAVLRGRTEFSAEEQRGTMRVQGLTGASTKTAPSAARRGASGTFQVSDGETSQGPAQASGLRAVSSVDVLIALQGIEDPTERRKRAVKNGRNALDVLDHLKLGLLEGNLDPSTLGRLKSAAEGLKGSSGDTGLDEVLSEIELRVEVELAKASRS
jgi:hypothetical protein